ncbi:titin-like isoform X2 [Danaus plexippus]|uniref:titin-like isoform X2 n=1 Tax=Danaus plexippus TaxID=13037 RepID=UPI002AAFC0DC|nr:titin-like isoform X2 [Danaus plexippus]
MSDNEDLLGDDLGDHSLADYNLGNEEEEQLLADDYDGGPSQNVPTANAYREQAEVVPAEYSSGTLEYSQPSYTAPDSESVVPNIMVEVPNTKSYTPYRDTFEQEQAVPPAIPATPIESPQIVPSEATETPNVENQERTAENRSQRSALPRNIPDSLDKVFVPNSFPGRGRAWRNPNRSYKPYRRYNYRGNFNNPRPAFAPPMRPQNINPQIRPDIPDIRPDIPMGPEISPERPILSQELPMDGPYNQNFQNFQFRPNTDSRPEMANVLPNPGPMFYQRPTYNPRFPPMREIINTNQMPQVTIRQPMPMPMPVKEPEVRMLPVPLPPNLPPGKKVLINPHFKGNFQPPVEGLAYIPTRIIKTPPVSPTLEAKFGPSLPVDEAAERFIAEQRQALARAAARNREPMRYIENTTIEIENELARSSRRSDDDLLRRQEEFINANRAGLRRRMRSPSPRRSPERARSPDRRRTDEESDYRRRVREQETLRERVLRAKEVRRRKNAVALQRRLSDKDKDQEKEVKIEEKKDVKPAVLPEQNIPDTTRKTPEKMEKVDKAEKTEKVIKTEKIDKRDRSPIKVERTEANSTCDTLTPPPLTPPLPRDSDDDLDLILDDIDDILSDEDSGRFKEKNKVETPKPSQVDLRSKLPPRESKPRQKIVFDKGDKKEKSPTRRTIVTGANKNNANEKNESKTVKAKTKQKPESTNTAAPRARQKIVYCDKLTQKQDKDKRETEKPKSQFTNRRVILQNKIQPNDKPSSRLQPTDKSFSRLQPGGIFSRAVTAIGTAKPDIEYESSDEDVKVKNETGLIAVVENLPYGMTDTRLKTLAGDIQNLILDKEDRSARITFKNNKDAEVFYKKFNKKMVAASRLSVTLK